MCHNLHWRQKKTHTYVSYIFIVIAVAHWDKLALQWCIYSQSDMELSYYTLYNVYVDYWQVYKIADFFSPCVALIRSQHICMCLCEGGNKKIWLSLFNHQFWKCEKKSPIDWLRSRASRSLQIWRWYMNVCQTWLHLRYGQNVIQTFTASLTNEMKFKNIIEINT